MAVKTTQWIAPQCIFNTEKKNPPTGPHADLYRAQTMAGEVFGSSLFPCYSPEHVKSQAGFKGKMLWCYSRAYDGACVVGRGVDAIISTVQYVVSKILFVGGYVFRPITNAIYPVNPINGRRHFVLIPRSVEKVLGDWVFYPLATSGMRNTRELLPGGKESIANKVNACFQRLLKANKALLNPDSEKTQFDYRVKTVPSSQVNAFAVPAGGMVVFSQLVKEIEGAIKNKDIKETKVTFADGSSAIVDFKDVKAEDVLAALMGHEMTHVASRHSIVSLVASAIRSIVLTVGRLILIVYLKSTDEEYRALAKKAVLNEDQRAALEFYSFLNDIFAWVENRVKQFSGLFNSRKNEYEADVTGTYFAHKAGFNPLGALYLQAVLHEDGAFDFFHKYFEFLFTHPYGENRKRAIFAAIGEIDPQALKGRVQWNIAQNGYNFDRSSPAVQYAYQNALKNLS
jgi:hypothetical protein